MQKIHKFRARNPKTGKMLLFHFSNSISEALTRYAKICYVIGFRTLTTQWFINQYQLYSVHSLVVELLLEALKVQIQLRQNNSFAGFSIFFTHRFRFEQFIVEVGTFYALLQDFSYLSLNQLNCRISYSNTIVVVEQLQLIECEYILCYNQIKTINLVCMCVFVCVFLQLLYNNYIYIYIRGGSDRPRVTSFRGSKSARGSRMQTRGLDLSMVKRQCHFDWQGVKHFKH